MKKFNNIIFSILFLCIATALQAKQHPNTVSRKEVKKYTSINTSSVMNISNRYGDINIETGKDIKDVEIEILFEAWSTSESKAQSMLESISVSDNSSGNNISLKTNTPSSVSINDRKGFKITYTVKAPESINLSLINKYGGIFSDDISGEAFIEVGYGNLTMKELKNESNEIIIKYGNGTIDYIEKGEFETKYLGKLNIGQANDIILDDAYGNINVGTAINVSGSSKYSNLNINNLKGQFNYQIGYGNINVDHVDKNFTGINASSSYGSIKLNLTENVDFAYEANVRYGSFKSNLSTLENYYQIEKNTSAEYKGYNLDKNSDKKLVLKSSYGSIKIN
ncbi:DUF4097 domain-containing protein [Flammeovirga yaeyamensis]|uniref:DUF4097 domain-containing protein n=1 Tax=Flammeovirga yaeyamensis TaxID=367791 RepID=A0AAX1NBV7_9BACT|nr:hypothetical protein [Flammeovirga yaeyamensis]MBB3699046.1 hypothetical protein [Flammeovirga yaeyamensis]NMF36480.1 hypothetical protein [Flammeovirga yaeyamensis]QWG03562.1 DUF4097 domain-containing protein [Flammeovirga yaeyamensis]